MEHLDTRSILLDMTTDLSRVANFVLQDKHKRAQQFADKLNQALLVLENRSVPISVDFFLEKTAELVDVVKTGSYTNKTHLAEDAFTYGNILSRRASRLEA